MTSATTESASGTRRYRGGGYGLILFAPPDAPGMCGGRAGQGVPGMTATVRRPSAGSQWRSWPPGRGEG